MLVLTTQAVWVTVCDCWFCLENCLESYIKLLNNFLIVCFWKGILGFISSGLKMIKNDVFKTFFCVFIVEKKPKKWCQSNMNMKIDAWFWQFHAKTFLQPCWNKLLISVIRQTDEQNGPDLIFSTFHFNVF